MTSTQTEVRPKLDTEQYDGYDDNERRLVIARNLTNNLFPAHLIPEASGCSSFQDGPWPGGSVQHEI